MESGLPSGLVPRVIFLAAPSVIYGLAALAPLRRTPLGRGAGLPHIALVAWLCAVLGLVSFAASGATTWPGPALVSLGGLGTVRLSVRADSLSSAMLLLISSLGWVILRYSQRYLAGEDGLPRYYRSLLATLCAVSLVVISNNLVILLVAWAGASLALHQLLTFYRQRPPAQLAARKKFVVSRLAELLLAAAFALLASHLGTLEIDAALSRLRALPELPRSLQLAAILIVLSTALKSAQLPVHGWLIQVMEAPTPVSALLHAGVVNLGGFVLLRLSGLIAASAEASALLLVIGSLTAGLAALVTLTRISIKVMLAWSTCAQLGFMFVECGLGAYELALLHLLAHSLYKAHAFLNAGSAVEGWRQRHLLPLPAPPSLPTWLAAGAFGAALGLVAGLVRSGASLQSAGQLLLAAIFGLALTPLLLAAAGRGWWSVLALGLTVVPLLLFLHSLGALLGHGSGLVATGSAAPVWASLGAAAVFVALFVVQGVLLSRPQSLQRLFPWFFGGLFLDELLTGSWLRLWARYSQPGQRPPAPGAALGLAVDGGEPASPQAVAQAIDEATRWIAPTWPLDQLIAVNPWSGLADRPFDAVAAELQLLSGAKLFLPRAAYRAAFESGELRREHLQATISASRSAWTIEQLVACLRDSPEPTPRLQLICDLLDAREAGQVCQRAMRWSDFVTHSISQFCAAWFDAGQALWRLPRQGGMYRSWRTLAAADRAPACLMGLSSTRQLVASLPDSPRALIAWVLSQLAIPASAYRSYLAALLLRQGGWAAWCAYERFEAQKQGESDEQIVDLLAIRLAWEWLLARQQPLAARELIDFHGQWLRLADLRARNRAAQHPDWLLQQALELAYQQPLCRALAEGPAAQLAEAAPSPAIQAVFCIDVRSEPLRRALEQGSPTIQTLGFAGFFGLPIDFSELGTSRPEPRLPGLLRPRLQVQEAGPAPGRLEGLAASRQRRIGRGQLAHALRTLASSAFALVESCGLLYAGKLLARSLPQWRKAVPAAALRASSGEPAHRLRPTLRGGEELASLAEAILRALGLTRDFADLILLCGHGSHCENNPQAAALQCGACGGHPGDVNAQVLAELLNSPSIRAALRSRGLGIPERTWFVAGLHDTATDAVKLFDRELVPASHTEALAVLDERLRQAGASSRRRRAESLGLGGQDDANLFQSLVARGASWAEVRPEWGLLGNACFIAAPRARSRELDLAGRAFLHDYDVRSDESLQRLEQIMTAPMVVAHWISLQYYASSVDPVRYGSGNKVLHNVVGGRLGVFEGNGGDLRIGLSLQSLSDGSRLRHTPLRLSVFVEAPQAAIAAVLARQPAIAELIRHEWLYLFQIDAEKQQVVRYSGGRVEQPPHIPSSAARAHEVAA